jgi:hypothetical protein
MADEATTTPKQGELDQPVDSGDKTFTQADLDRVVQERLSRERQKYEGFDDLKDKASKFDELQEKNQSELEKAAAKATKAEKRADDAEGKLLRFEVAAEKQVPSNLLPLLTAQTRVDLEAQADLILENAKTADPTPEFDGGAREPAPEPVSPEQGHNNFLLQTLGISPKT